MAFNLADVLAGVPNLGTGREQIEYIGIDQIVPDPDNFYDLSGLDGLAENISLLGLQQPLRVRPVPGDDSKFMIISGHRRHAALKMLIEQDGRDDLREVPCIVERGVEENPKLTQLKLIYANAHTRVLTSAEISKQAEQVEKLLYELKEDGMEFPGRMRDHVAQAVGTSKSKLARLKVIREGLSDFWRPLWDSGELKEAVAYELAHISKDRQWLIFEKFGKSQKNISDLTSDAITTYNSRFDRIDKITCKKQDSVCTNKYNMQKKSLEVSRWYQCECKQCCSDCSDLASCKHACSMLKDKQQKLRRKKQEQQNQKEIEAEERDRPKIDFISKVYSRFGEALDNMGLTVKQFSEKNALPYPDEKIEHMINGSKKINADDRFPFGYSFFLSDAKALCDVADLLGCSIDYLLGRTDCVTADQAPKPATEKVPNCGTWQTGDPPEPGDYIAYGLCCGAVACDIAAWLGYEWNMDMVCLDSISAWAYPPDKAVPIFDAPAADPENASTQTPDPAYEDCCITGMSGSGRCGAAYYCPEPHDCCLQCDKDCNLRCGWIDAEEKK